MSDCDRRSVFVVGIDGATFDVIKPMVERGMLPNLARLMLSGVCGSLHSVVPHLSPAAWSSCVTGKHPGKHGILDFFGQLPDSYGVVFYNGSCRTAKPLWTILGESGKKVCVINVPMTFPPDRVNGIMISGMDTPDSESNFVHPPSLRRELEEKIGGYIIEKPRMDVGKDIPGYLRNLYEVNDNRFRAAEYLIVRDEWDFFMVVFESVDRVQHNFWKYMDPDHPLFNRRDADKYGDIIFDTYRDIDSKLGALMRYMPKGAILIVVSDHGFGPLYKGVRLTRWLEEQGYLALTRTFPRMIGVRAVEKVARMLPRSLKSYVRALKPSPEAPGVRHGVLAHIDMSRTRAYPMGGYGNLCINLKGRQPCGMVNPGREYEELRNTLIEQLRQLRDPTNGKRIIDNAWKREDVYDSYPETTPDILISWAPGYSHVGEGEPSFTDVGRLEDVLFTSHRWSGNHLPEGIVLIQGEPIKRGFELEACSITDITPTVLALMSLDLPQDMDGKVLEDAFKEPFEAKLRSILEEGKGTKSRTDGSEGTYTDEEREKIIERLRALGYMD